MVSSVQQGSTAMTPTFSLDDIARATPRGAAMRAVIARHLDDRAAWLNIASISGNLPDPAANPDIWPVADAADTFHAAALMLAELVPNASVIEALTFAHAVTKFACTFRLLAARERLAGGSRSLQ